jgi:hypothetical protein
MDALNKVGRKRIFADQGVSGATIEREGMGGYPRIANFYQFPFFIFALPFCNK